MRLEKVLGKGLVLDFEGRERLERSVCKPLSAPLPLSPLTFWRAGRGGREQFWLMPFEEVALGQVEPAPRQHG